MREYVPTPNPYEDPFHTYSWLQAFVVALTISLGLLAYHSFPWCVVFGVLCALWYWLLFDPWLNKGTYKNWDYLGNDSTIDRWLKKRFGKNGGQIKAIIMVVLIVLINAVKIVL